MIDLGAGSPPQTLPDSYIFRYRMLTGVNFNHGIYWKKLIGSTNMKLSIFVLAILLQTISATPLPDEDSLVVDKRSGFVGMRGKKDYYPAEMYEDQKRAGFVGMRGKKALEELDNDSELEAELRAFLDTKRAGFVGMRGKKDQGFMGMRGRRGGGGYYYANSAYWPYFALNTNSAKMRRGSSGFVGMRG